MPWLPPLSIGLTITGKEQFTEDSFSKIIDFFHFENGKEILDW